MIAVPADPVAPEDVTEPDEIEVGGPPPEPTCVQTALDRLQQHHDDHGHYDDEHVAALVGLINGAAENVARHERERWAWHLRQVARGSSMSDATKTGLRMAASLIERSNRETS